MKDINEVIAADRRFVREVAGPAIGKILEGVFDREVSHFEDEPHPNICGHQEHNPPRHMVIPPGKRYVHICPGCGFRAVISGSNVRW